MIPITIVDNFLDEPQHFVEFANRLDYRPCPKGLWPGRRSDKLHEVAFPLYDNIATRIMALFHSIHDVLDGEVDCLSLIHI